MSYAPGDRVIIHREAPHKEGVGVLGKVVQMLSGSALGGGKVALVEFQDPVDWRDYMLRLSLDQLAPATAERLQAMAERYECLAEDLRSLAKVAQ